MKEKKTKEFVPKREIKIYVPKELKFEIQAHAENREGSHRGFFRICRRVHGAAEGCAFRTVQSRDSLHADMPK